MDTRMT